MLAHLAVVSLNIVGLERRTAGVMRFNYQFVAYTSDKSLSRRVQKIFQDLYASLNPKMNFGEIVAVPIRLHSLRTGNAVQEWMQELLSLVELLSSAADQYP